MSIKELVTKVSELFSLLRESNMDSEKIFDTKAKIASIFHRLSQKEKEMHSEKFIFKIASEIYLASRFRRTR